MLIIMNWGILLLSRKIIMNVVKITIDVDVYSIMNVGDFVNSCLILKWKTKSSFNRQSESTEILLMLHFSNEIINRRANYVTLDISFNLQTEY